MRHSKSDIKRMIDEFRENYEKDRCAYCPFRNHSNGVEYGRSHCSICSEIFKLTPPRADGHWNGYCWRRGFRRVWRDDGRIVNHFPPCPCTLYDNCPERVAAKIDEYLADVEDE